jgi:quercetin dioxygenase-like cupin family protein
MRRLAVPLLALIVAVLLTITLASGDVAEASGGHDSSVGFGVTKMLAGPAMFTGDVSASFKVRYDQGRTLTANLPRGASNTMTVEVTWQADGTSGWHTHPGPVIVNVTEGQVIVTNANDCRPRTYGPGQAFVDPGQGNVHIASNASGTDQAKAVATFFGVPAGSPATIMAPPAIRPAQDASSSKVSGPSGSSTSSEVTRQAPSCSSSSTVTRPGT